MSKDEIRQLRGAIAREQTSPTLVLNLQQLKQVKSGKGGGGSDAKSQGDIYMARQGEAAARWEARAEGRVEEKADVVAALLAAPERMMNKMNLQSSMDLGTTI
jgi:hypothetical protein